MANYRVRSCPKCRYYVGYRLARPLPGDAEISIKSFCLNCNYQFPVRALLVGRNRIGPRRLQTLVPARQTSLQRPNYSRELRVIGQELEKRGFNSFNLKCSSEAYFVWSTELDPLNSSTVQPFKVAALAAGHQRSRASQSAATAIGDRTAGLLFDAADLKRLERQGIQARRIPATMGANGRRLSHLLRTVGEEVYRRNQRLLALSWQQHQIAVVVENAGGGREINVLRTEQLYDLWVRMYLRRLR